MEREIIERLAIDHALGELNTDAAVLFEAYLAEHAEARTWAEPMAETCLRTREAIDSKTPSLAREDPPPTVRVCWPAGLNGRVVGRWAAVIVIALGIGAGLGRRSAPETPTGHRTVVQAEQPPSPKGWDRVLSESSDGFWQAKALAVMQSKSYEPPRPRPAAAGPWDRYRQTRKEWRYE